METWQAICFLAGSAGLLYISRDSLARPRSHGFYRFFAWELILASLLLNVPHWIENWSAWYQVISWALLFASIIPLFLGLHELRVRGQPDLQRRSAPELFEFERTTRLVTDGIYRYIRHPLYSSLFLLAWGIFFKRPSPVGLVLAIVTAILLIGTAKADEAECVETFGTEYRQYMQRSRMFIPYIL